MRTGRDRGDAGFTLLEVVVAVVLVGIVSAVAVVGIGSLTRSGATASCAASLDATRTAITLQVAAGAETVGFDDLVAIDAITLPDGATVAPDGRSIATSSWTLVLAGTPVAPTCVDGRLWTPADLGASAAFWLDAGTLGGPDGTPVDAWSSRATQARSATAPGSVHRPSLASAGIGGMPAVRFDGVDDRLAFDGAFLAGTDFTVAAVTAREAAFGRGYYLGSSGTSEPGTAFILGYDADSLVRYSHRNDGINASVAPFGTVTPTLHVARSSTSGRALWIDGAPRGTASPLPLTMWSSASVGRDTAGFFRGVVGEVVMVTSSLSDADRQRLEGYLAWRWGTVTALPASHPYRSAPPAV